MNKQLITIGFIILSITVIGKSIFSLASRIKVDDFRKSAIVFVLDTSDKNVKLEEETDYLRSLCAILDPEDAIKIIKVEEKSYIIFEGSPADASGIRKAISEYTKERSNENAYGEGIKKAFDYALTMKKEGFIPSIVVLGTMEETGDVSKQINWDTLPKNIKNVQNYVPEISMMFAYAEPEKLDIVKTKLNPVLGEKKLIIANSIGAEKASRRLLQAIGR
ncbi:VWA domain-containing protein [bacterium]|nr:VWA domain-containing protein [bacterium]